LNSAAADGPLKAGHDVAAHGLIFWLVLKTASARPVDQKTTVNKPLLVMNSRTGSGIAADDRPTDRRLPSGAHRN
jgi:hypothetical protein